jgi:hypothetical protein
LRADPKDDPGHRRYRGEGVLQNPARLPDAIYWNAQIATLSLEVGRFFLVALRIPLLLSPTTLNRLIRFLARPENLEKGLGCGLKTAFDPAH